MKKLIALCTALLCCCGIVCSANAEFDITPEEAGAVLNENYYACINFERFKTDKIPYGEMLVSVAEDWTEDALKNELYEIIGNKESYSIGTNERKIADFYEQLIDEESRNEVGIAPLEEILSRIENAQDIDSLIDVSAEMMFSYGTASIFSFKVDAGIYDSSKYALMESQMSMPVNPLNIFKVFGTADNLQKGIKNVIEFRGGENASERARNSTDMLIKIAEYAKNEYEIMTSFKFKEFGFDEFEKMFSADISGYTDKFRKYGIDNVLIVNTDEMEVIAQLLTEDNLQAWKDYLSAQILYKYADYLPPDKVDILAPFGAEKENLNDNKIRDIILNETGREFSYIFACEYADEERMQSAREFTEEIIQAYERLIRSSKDIDEKTKAGFIGKLENMQINIDIPHEPYDGNYDWIPAEKGGNFLENIIRKKSGELCRTLDTLGREFDKTAYQWDSMPPFTFNNACYHPANYVTIPYAEITDPIYNPDGDRYQNIGYLGACLTHEISHAFDSNGMNFDENGNFNPDWIGEEYSKVLERKKADITELFNNQKLFGIYPLNGKKTLGENMADIAAVQAVLMMADTNEEKKAIFEEYAKSWYMLAYDSDAFTLLYDDEHSPNEFRVNTVLSQMDEFYEVYGITDGSMYTPPEERRRVW